MQPGSLSMPVVTRPARPSLVGQQGQPTTRVVQPTVTYQTAAAGTSAAARVVTASRTGTSAQAAAPVVYPSSARTVVTQSAASGSPIPTPVATTVVRGAQASSSLPQTVVRTVPQASVVGSQLPPTTIRVQSQVAPQTVTVQGASGTGTLRPVTLRGPTYTQNTYEAKHQDDPKLNTLKELRRTSGLKNVPVVDGLLSLKSGAVDGKLTRQQFLEAYEVLLQNHGVEVPSEDVRHAVFDLFDRDNNDVVDMMELVCGISLLCAGTEDEKIQAVFRVFDENSDGYISMDEMFKFLTSVFKVVLTPNVLGVMNSMGVAVESAEDLASVTALECFKSADLNHDGKLSVAEFKNWFYTPRNDPSSLFSPVRKLLT